MLLSTCVAIIVNHSGRNCQPGVVAGYDPGGRAHDGSESRLRWPLLRGRRVSCLRTSGGLPPAAKLQTHPEALRLIIERPVQDRGTIPPVFHRKPCVLYFTPRLRQARFVWDGEERYVDVAADLLKSPDCGIFKVDVDGRELIQGVTMEIEIFKDVRTEGGRKTRLRSAMTAEVDPRNESM